MYSLETIRKLNEVDEAKIKHKDLLAYIERIDDVGELKSLVKDLAEVIYVKRAFCKKCGSYQG